MPFAFRCFDDGVPDSAGSGVDDVALVQVTGHGRRTSSPQTTRHTVSVLVNQGSGTFAAQVTYAVGSGAYSVALADVTWDWKLDIVTANAAEYGKRVGSIRERHVCRAGRLCRGQRCHWRRPGGRYRGWEADIVTTNFSDNTVSVLVNQGSGTFAAKVDYAVGGHA